MNYSTATLQELFTAADSIGQKYPNQNPCYQLKFDSTESQLDTAGDYKCSYPSHYLPNQRSVHPAIIAFIFLFLAACALGFLLFLTKLLIELLLRFSPQPESDDFYEQVKSLMRSDFSDTFDP